jgi:hypothetical protein
LAGLALAPLEGDPEPLTAPETWSDVTWRPGATGSAQRSLTGVRLVRDDDRWRLVLLEDDAEISCVVGTGDWATNLVETEHGATGVPVAVAGGWVDEDTFRADVIFLETPHRLELTGSRSTSTFDLAWVTVALRAAGLSDLRMPRSAETSTSAHLG